MLGLLVTCVTGFAGEITSDVNRFDQKIKPLLQQYCVRCHRGTEAKGDIRLDDIDPDIVHGSHFDRWEDIREAFHSGEMPPEDERQPTSDQRDIITTWLDSEFKKTKQRGRTKQGGAVRRLTRYELQYALEDLLGVSAQQEVSALPEEGTSVETGLKNNSRLLVISGPHLESYLDAIIALIGKMKKIAAFEPYAESINIKNLDVNPPASVTRDGRKRKPPVAKIQRSGSGVTIAPAGYIDLPIRAISEFMFQTTVLAKADQDAQLQVSIGFTHSEVDPRQRVANLGVIHIGASEVAQSYTLDSFPESLPREMTRALDRPFFIRIVNRGKTGIYLEEFNYRGNVNTDLTTSLIPSDLAKSDLDTHIRQSIYQFVEQAFRRSPTDIEMERYLTVYQDTVKSEKELGALLSTYKEVLCSPSFFYLGLSADLTEEAKENYKLAEKLSFFLWCSVPDHHLLADAYAGRLTKPEVLSAQVKRMLANEKSKRWVEQFTSQWLQTSKLFNVAVDKNYYPKFRDELKSLMLQETIESVNDVFRHGATAMDLLEARHVFVNQALAGHYRIRGVRGDEFRKTPISENDHRGGLLTQGTFLVGNSDGMDSHAILRGVWLTQAILNDPPPDPPKNVPPFDESIPGFDKMTLNEKLFAHRNNAACKNCHQKIDPWGIAFENYDASGAWRDKVLVVSLASEQPKNRKKPVFEKSFIGIDHSATLDDGTTVNGIQELKEYLVTHRKQDFGKGLTKRILAYALSRDIDYHDEDFVNDLSNRFEQSNYSVPLLIGEIVQSESFRAGK